MVPFERSVTVAVGHGKKAAKNIDAWLSGMVPEPVVRPALATYDTLNTWYYADAPRTERPVLERTRRSRPSTRSSRGSTRRTRSMRRGGACRCGNCFGCDNCYGVCPDNAVIKLGQPGEKYLIDLDYCKGCGICVAECPSGAIQMFPEDLTLLRTGTFDPGGRGG